MSEPKNTLPADVAGKYELKGLEPGPVLFPKLGEIDLRKISLAQADEIHKIRPNILVLKGNPRKPEPETKD